MTQNNGQINQDLELSSYDYQLPEELIASRPPDKREKARLLVYDEQTDQIFHDVFENLSDYLEDETQLFFNQSRVFPCRLNAQKSTGAKVEIFVLSLVPEAMGIKCLLKSSGKKKVGDVYELPAGVSAQLKARDTQQGLFWLDFSTSDLANYLERYARIPIPPYIRGGEDDERDRHDYQTSYADEAGSVAAPTAGLHFSESLLEQLKGQGHSLHFLTLHVGMGTFAPVKTERILDHKMHEESYCLGTSAHEALQTSTKRVAVGTTSLRAMESCVSDESWPAIDPLIQRSTDIFLYPGKSVKSIEGLITNFHLPKSTLLMLVSSLIGREKTLELYQEAIDQGYKFFSYGDGMYIKRKRL